MEYLEALLRAVLSIFARRSPEVLAPRRTCGVRWREAITTIVVFAIVMAAMVKLTTAGVPLGVAVGVVVSAGVVTAKILARFGSGPEPV